VDCPLDCEFLQEARRRDKPQPLEMADFPNRDLQVSRKLVQENQELLTYLGVTIFRTAMHVSGVVDNNVHEALESLVRTYRTLQSGVYYESRPAEPLAGSIYATVQDALTEYRSAEQQKLGMTKTRDADVLAVLVYLQHFAIDRSNGRSRGRAFLDSLRQLYPPGATPPGPSPSSLILP